MKFLILLIILGLVLCNGKKNHFDNVDTTIVTTGNILYTPYTSSVSINSIDYWDFNGCSYARNGQTIASLIINIPGDSPGSVAVEINCSPTNWSLPPFSNYEIDSLGVLTTYLNITFDWTLCSGDTRYVRVIGESSTTQYTLQMIFDDSLPLFSGVYNYNVFRQANPNPSYNQVYQYASAYGIQDVQYKNYEYFVAGFCAQDVANVNSPWQVVVTVIADPSYPDSGFNVVVCGDDFYASPTACTITNINVPQAYKSAANLAVNNVIVTNLYPDSSYNLTQPFIIGVYGTSLGSNYFSLFVTYVP